MAKSVETERKTRAQTITDSDRRAWRARNPLCTKIDSEEIDERILEEHPCDVGFTPRY